jgi:hypothetical protein
MAGSILWCNASKNSPKPRTTIKNLFKKRIPLKLIGHTPLNVEKNKKNQELNSIELINCF